MVKTKHLIDVEYVFERVFFNFVEPEFTEGWLPIKIKVLIATNHQPKYTGTLAQLVEH